MDPTFEVYFKDNNAGYLSLQELRERLVNGKKMDVSDEINYNGKKYWGRKGKYINYITKNVFRFSCPISGEYNYESANKERTYIFLNPSNYNPKGKYKTVTDKRGNKINSYYISNPIFFWAKSF